MRAAFAAIAAIAAIVTMMDLRRVRAIDPALPDPAIAAELDDVLDRAMREYTIAGVAAGAIRNGEVIWSARKGQASADGVPVTDATAFNLGSISKPLTVWAVLALVRAGRVELDAPLSAYLHRYTLPSGTFNSEGVTVRRLLRHTAGTTVIGYGGYGAHEDQPADALELSEDFAPVAVMREPGTARRYSGGGYVLLQMMVEDVTGEAFDDAVRRLVLDPLGMVHSGFDPDRLPTRSDAFNYYGRPIEALRDVALAAAGGYASGADIERFLLAHRDGGPVLDRAMLDAAFAPTEPDARYAMSYTRWETPQGVLLGHGGNNSTWHGQIYIRPDTGDAFYFLANATGGAQLDYDLGCAWLSMVQTEEGAAHCAAGLDLAHRISWIAWALAMLALFLAYWLAAGLAKGRRRLALLPFGRGPVRLAGRMTAFFLTASATVFAAWIFYTNSVIWRTQTVLIDEIPLDELEGLTAAIMAVLVLLTVALWSSPVPGRESKTARR
jgi:CubicO group peptidase (beta-lactamase class C family)